MKWEYLAAKLTDSFDGDSINLTKELNFMGQKGWELINLDLTLNSFVFKRPKPIPDYRKDTEILSRQEVD